MIVLGIDPGLSGAVVLLDLTRPATPRLLHVADMPVVEARQGKSIKRHLNLALLASLALHPAFPRPDAAVIEQVGAMPGQGVTSMFRFGYAAGAVAGIVAAHQIPLTLVRPQEWRALAGLRPGQDKDAGRLRASQLFPAHAHLFARVKDNGRSDAALIAFSFGRQKSR